MVARRVLPSLSLACLALALAARAAEPDPEPNPLATPGRDRPVDPDKDCKFKHEKAGLTITLPGKHHDLIVGRGNMNAPRLLREVEGDFVAEVRVSGDFAPSATSAARREGIKRAAPPSVGAGLLVMASDKTYARLEREVERHGERGHSFASLWLWQPGYGEGHAASFTLPKGKAVYLRLERRGDRLLGSYSRDGKRWFEIDPFVVKLPAKLKVGVTAHTNSTDPFSPHFDRFKLSKPKRH